MRLKRSSKTPSPLFDQGVPRCRLHEPTVTCPAPNLKLPVPLFAVSQVLLSPVLELPHAHKNVRL
jgi:hypothetical protein